MDEEILTEEQENQKQLEWELEQEEQDLKDNYMDYLRYLENY